jgi:hypothetical protein
MKLSWPAPERNKGPIREVLARVLPAHGTLLEIAAGSGQHAAYFAAAFPGITYLPTDCDAAHIASIAAYRAEAGLSNLAEPRLLDVCAAVWDVPALDAAFNANMLPIRKALRSRSAWRCPATTYRWCFGGAQTSDSSTPASF